MDIHSDVAVRGFPFSHRNKICNENVNPIPIKMKTPERWRPSRIVPSLSLFLPKDVKWRRAVTSHDVSHYYPRWTATIIKVNPSTKRFSRESADLQTDRQTIPILYPRPLTREGKIYFRWEANHIYSHSEWYCHSHSFKIFQSVYLLTHLQLHFLYFIIWTETSIQ